MVVAKALSHDPPDCNKSVRVEIRPASAVICEPMGSWRRIARAENQTRRLVRRICHIEIATKARDDSSRTGQRIRMASRYGGGMVLVAVSHQVGCTSKD